MLYECISGRKPFGGDTAPTILYRIIHEAPDPIDLSHLNDISPAIRSVLDRSLAKDPEDRYESAEEFARALRAAKDPTWQGSIRDATVRMNHPKEVAPSPAPSCAPPTQILEKLGSRRPPHLALLGGIAVFILLLGTGVAVFRMGARKAATPMKTLAASSEAPLPATPIIKTPTPKPTQEKHRSETIKPTAVSKKELPPQAGSMIGISEAINLADSDPRRSLEGFRAIIEAHPSHANAYAWTIAILYEQGRFNEIPAVFAKARENGIGRARMMANVRFRVAMQNDRLNRRIPGSVNNNHPGDE
jgi:serine/threonine-protein kinase